MDDPFPQSPVQVELDQRAVLRLSGADARTLLQGLVTNDVTRVSETQAVYAGLLTPQGKFLFDFVMVADGADLLLECARSEAPALLKRLTLYRLRADVQLRDASEDLSVWSVPGQSDALGLSSEPGHGRREGAAILFTDPRLAALGARMIAPRGSLPLDLPADDPAAYDRVRLHLGVPEAPTDIVPERSFPLECNFEDMHGVDFRKGCYVGQEVTARSKHRGSVRSRILPLESAGPVPEPGTAITAGGKPLGTVRSGRDNRALAQLRIDRWRDAQAAGAVPEADGQTLTIRVPPWVALPAAA